jgi:putative ABC transport system permease protein
MISGTYVLTDTIKAAYTGIVDDSFKNADAVISGKVAFKNTESNTAETPAFPATVLTKVKQLPTLQPPRA